MYFGLEYVMGTLCTHIVGTIRIDEHNQFVATGSESDTIRDLCICWILDVLQL